MRLHEEARHNRRSPNLRSTNHPFLGGRAITHLVIECKRLIGICEAESAVGLVVSEAANQGVVALSKRLSFGQSTLHVLNPGHPLCYYAYRRGPVISANLLRLPVSSDCAFIRSGCSVSSRYTFP